MKQFLILFLSLSIIACNNNAEPSSPAQQAFDAAAKAYKENPDVGTASKYIDQILTKIGDNVEDKSKVIALSEEAYQVAKDNKIASKARGFLFSLIKEDYNNPATKSRILELANQMSAIKRAGTANILFKSLMDNFANTDEANIAKTKLDPGVTDLNNYIINIGEEITKGEVDKFGINRNAALQYVDACEAYALGYPDSADAPENLYKAAEIAKTIRTFPKLMSIYDWIIEKYPNFERTPTIFFLKGFVLENDLGNDAEAKKVYEAFIEKFPNHGLRDDIDFLLEHLGKSEEEIRRIIEEKQKEKQLESN